MKLTIVNSYSVKGKSLSETKPTYEMLEEKMKLLESSATLMGSLQEQVKLNSSFLEMLFHTIPNPIFYKDRDGIYQNCNDAFSKTILGIPREEIIGKSLYEFPKLIPRELAKKRGQVTNINYDRIKQSTNHKEKGKDGETA